MPSPRILAVSLLVSAAVALAAGCGGDSSDGFRNDGSVIDGDPSTTLPPALASTKSSIKTREPGQPLPKDTSITGVSTDLSKKPAVPKGNGPAPTSEVKGTDVVVGTGAEAAEGDTVSVDYVGVLYKDAKEFDTSWGKEPFSFTIGEGGVIQGWEQGVPGMKVGGRRTLVIPAVLAYGSAGSPPTIPADAPLTFVIDLKKVTKKKAG